MKHKTVNGCRIKSGMTGFLLAGLIGVVNAANVAYVANTGPGFIELNTQWPTTRFVADASGNCIIDNLTGLMWAKNASLLGTGAWGSSATAGTAQYKIAQMNTDSSTTSYQLCGYTDWRLPNINELSSLINYRENNLVDWLNSKHFTNVHAGQYWSSTVFDGRGAWYVSFDKGGGTRYALADKTYYVWPVRGGR